jgi:hypothetical protein
MFFALRLAIAAKASPELRWLGLENEKEYWE